MSRFTEQETRQLAMIAAGIEASRKHVEQAESLDWSEITSDPYELGIIDDYKSQTRALLLHFQQLLDLRLDQSTENADRVERGILEGRDLLEALSSELKAIVSRLHREAFGHD